MDPLEEILNFGFLSDIGDELKSGGGRWVLVDINVG